METQKHGNFMRLPCLVALAAFSPNILIPIVIRIIMMTHRLPVHGLWKAPRMATQRLASSYSRL